MNVGEFESNETWSDGNKKKRLFWEKGKKIKIKEAKVEGDLEGNRIGGKDLWKQDRKLSDYLEFCYLFKNTTSKTSDGNFRQTSFLRLSYGFLKINFSSSMPEVGTFFISKSDGTICSKKGKVSDHLFSSYNIKIVEAGCLYKFSHRRKI